MLCYDVMELVGREVLKVREVYQNIAKYDSVVGTMGDMFREAYGHQTFSDEDYEDYDAVSDEYEQCCDDQSLDPNYSSHDEHNNTFISDFKDCMYEFRTSASARNGTFLHPELMGSNRDMCGKWSNGWGGRSGSAGWTSPATARGVMIRYEIYGIYN